MTWNIVYRGACSEHGVLLREELKDASDDLASVILNGNCPERFSNKVKDAEVVAIAQAIAQTDNVTELDLSYNSLTDEGSRQLAGMLKQNKSLRHLNLAYNSIEHKGWRTLANALVDNKTLLTLNVAGNSITGDSDPHRPELREIGGKLIGTMLRENHVLQCLNLRMCGLGVSSLIGIAQALIEHPSLESLDISSPMLSGVQERASVSQHLSEMLKKNNVLAELNLTRSMVTDEHFGMMLPAFVFNEGLRSLLLSANKLSEDGGAFVAKLLARRHDISVVDLSSNNLSTPGAISIAQTLKANQGISTLNLSHCGIGEEGLIAIAQGLKANSSICTLVLWGNHWTPKAAKVWGTTEESG